MTPEQFAKLLNYIQENNSWAKLGETVSRNRVAVKYVDSYFDTRTNDIFEIKLRCGLSEGKTFRINSESDIDKIYKFLDKPLNR